MKKIFISAVLILTVTTSWATLYTQSFSGGTIADGNPVGQTFVGTFTTAPSGSALSDVTIGLNISGGYNSDLYAYLIAPNGTMVVLMNQPGGLTGGGMNVTLSDGIFTSIQDATSSGTLTGTYNAMGSLGNFDGSAVNGNWTLYFADLSSGGTSTLDSWTLNITAVPEPVSIAFAVFGFAFFAQVLLRKFQKC